MTVARVRIETIRLKVNYLNGEKAETLFLLECDELTENGSKTKAVFARYSGRKLWPWEMHPPKTFGRKQ